MPDLIFIYWFLSFWLESFTFKSKYISVTVIYFFPFVLKVYFLLVGYAENWILSNFWDICLERFLWARLSHCSLVFGAPACLNTCCSCHHKVWCWNCFYLPRGHVLDRMMLQLQIYPCLDMDKVYERSSIIWFSTTIAPGSADTKYIALI